MVKEQDFIDNHSNHLIDIDKSSEHEKTTGPSGVVPPCSRVLLHCI